VVRRTVRTFRSCGKLVLCFACTVGAWAQQAPETRQVPRNYTFDLETAARLRPQLMAQSIPPTGSYSAGRIVFDHLIKQLPNPSVPKFKWELRIVEDDQFNAYSSPDGTIFVETGLARLAASSPGLWAALLSHEIAHVLRRDWARRYLYQKSLEAGSAIVIAGPGAAIGPDAHWSDAQSASIEFARFCRQLEIEADREGLSLMALAGYHPDFVPALHHLLHAQRSHAAQSSSSLAAMHPCWEERDRDLNRAYTDAGIEFERRWKDWYASPGGNPPTLVFAETPTVRKARNESTGARQWELSVPMHCENLVGTIQVVLEAEPGTRNAASPASITRARIDGEPAADSQESQLSGCTSPRTTITFTIGNAGAPWTDVYILDASGKVLARTDIPKLPH